MINIAFLSNFSKIILKFINLDNFNINNLFIYNGYFPISIANYTIKENNIEIFLIEDINIKNETYLYYDKVEYKVHYYPLYSSEAFNSRYYFEGELGFKYNGNSSTFNIWSPAATSINLLIYYSGNIGVEEIPREIPMKEGDFGVWTCTLEENLEGHFYTYKVNVYNETYEAVDPYAKALGINGHRGAIIDMNKTNPPGWKEVTSPTLNNFTDSIIYEVSIRDISMYPNSGVFHKGKYLGLTEYPILNHLKELGITHLQIMPFYDFSHRSVDEQNPLSFYNWGYDPQNYNAPEGSLSTNPYDPYIRIYELKKMVLSLHENGFRINMDVVYNHLWDAQDNNFQKIFPGYYLRYNNEGFLSNGSACGNDTASEHLMMRKFIVDSIKYWVTEYHIDGFRMDLMGLHDIETVNLIRYTLDKIDESLMLYGEGWNLSTTLPIEKRAIKDHHYQMPKVGHFNDLIRDSIKGHVFNYRDTGFATGKQGMENNIKACVKGIFSSPYQGINYVSCHDNHTLWDRINLNCEYDSLEDKKYMHKLCNAIVFTSQGIPFIHSGVEFCRSKSFVENSFRSSDHINWMDYDRIYKFGDVFSYYKDLIKLRKEHPAFRMNSKEIIDNDLEFIENTPSNVVAFLLKDHANGDSWRDILIIYNSNKNSQWINIPEKEWNLVGTRDLISSTAIRTFSGDYIEVDGVSMTVLFS
ncbi:type I pullulanase [Clostridium malenominatum]|uniref:Type I pullulanase n=1 Tax=Clostridium malenominatum TaxID=1539 RepID=A0ABP3TXQ8_9CLOT